MCFSLSLSLSLSRSSPNMAFNHDCTLIFRNPLLCESLPISWGWSAHYWKMSSDSFCVCVNHSRKEIDPLPRRRSSRSSTVIPALHVSVMLTLLELKRSQWAMAHILGEETLISWWAEHPVSLPINTSGGTIQVGVGRGEGVSRVIKPTCRPLSQIQTTEQWIREVGKEGRGAMRLLWCGLIHNGGRGWHLGSISLRPLQTWGDGCREML